jgi:exosortase K
VIDSPPGRLEAAASWLHRRRWQLVSVTLALAVVVAGKQLYRDASAGELAWILAPTAQLVSWTTGGTFAYEAAHGWVDPQIGFLIAPPCAGVNFALAAFLALALGSAPGMRSPGAVAVRLAAAAALAYLATLVVNTVRIVIAVEMHRGTIATGDLDRAELHRVEGIVVYLGGLLALYALARAIANRRSRVAAC